MVLFVGSKASGTIFFQDDFTTGVNPAWVTDRAEPAGFTNNGAGNLEISISNNEHNVSEFHNTQGRKANVSSSGQSWTLTAQVNITQNMLTDDGLPNQPSYRSDIWARTNLGGDLGSEMTSEYHILGFQRYDSGNPGDSSAATFGWRWWDNNTGWNAIASSAGVTDLLGWNDLEISSTLAGVEFKLNGTVVGFDGVVSNPNDLTTIYLQAKNFGALEPGDTTEYLYDNVQVIPEPNTVFLGVLGALALLRRKR